MRLLAQDDVFSSNILGRQLSSALDLDMEHSAGVRDFEKVGNENLAVFRLVRFEKKRERNEVVPSLDEMLH